MNEETWTKMFRNINGDRRLQILAQGRWRWRRVFFKKEDSKCPVCGGGFRDDEPVYYVTHPSYWREYFICVYHELEQEVMTLG